MLALGGLAASGVAIYLLSRQAGGESSPPNGGNGIVTKTLTVSVDPIGFGTVTTGVISTTTSISIHPPVGSIVTFYQSPANFGDLGTVIFDHWETNWGNSTTSYLALEVTADGFVRAVFRLL